MFHKRHMHCTQEVHMNLNTKYLVGKSKSMMSTDGKESNSGD